MKNISSWLIAIFMFMFWVFRVIVAFQAQYEKDFGGFKAFNLKIEVILLFIVVLCIILFLRRNIIGGIIYIIAYGYYFGGYIFSSFLPQILAGENIGFITLQNSLVAALGFLLAFLALFDLIIDRARKRDPKDKKTDWFFQNEKYSRKLDERADKNEYRNY